MRERSTPAGHWFPAFCTQTPLNSAWEVPRAHSSAITIVVSAMRCADAHGAERAGGAGRGTPRRFEANGVLPDPGGAPRDDPDAVRVATGADFVDRSAAA